LECGDVVERDDPSGERRVDRRPEVAAAGLDPPIVGEPGERLTDAAVVVEVMDRDERAAGDLPGEPDREAVGVRGGYRELPVARPEPTLELLADPRRVLGREHVGDSPGHLALDGPDRGR